MAIWRTFPRISLEGLTYEELFAVFGVEPVLKDWWNSPTAYLYRLWVELRANTTPPGVWTVAIAVDHRTGEKKALSVFSKAINSDCGQMTHELMIKPVELSPAEIADHELMQTAYISKLVSDLAVANGTVAQITEQYYISETVHAFLAPAGGKHPVIAAESVCERAKGVAMKIVKRLSTDRISLTVAARRLQMLSNIFQRQQIKICIA